MNPDIPDWMKYNPPPTPQGSGALARILGDVSNAPTSTPLPPAPEKSLIQKIQDFVVQGKKYLELNKKPTKDILVQRIRQIRFLLLSIFGKDATMVKSVDLILKETNTKNLSGDQFAQILSDVESLLEFLIKTGDSSLSCQISQTSRLPATKNIFVIHGHDELNTRRLTQLLQHDFKLNPIAMLSKPGMSRPLIEKFENEAQTCAFAFGLFTPDDEIVSVQNHYKQARPNVIYEVGWFIGRLGKQR